MPLLGNSAILFVALGVFFARAVPAAFELSLAGPVLVVGDMVVTLSCNVPLNRKVQSWQAHAPPTEWKHVRDRWERFHSDLTPETRAA